jgi:hypothetical protein
MRLSFAADVSRIPTRQDAGNAPSVPGDDSRESIVVHFRMSERVFTFTLKLFHRREPATSSVFENVARQRRKRIHQFAMFSIQALRGADGKRRVYFEVENE